jgi:hypothetical protein
MRRIAAYFGLIALSFFASVDIMAQKAIYTYPEGLSLGFGGGASYQASDLANSRGFGADFIIGTPIYQRENAFLSVDWKFRFLGGQNRAYDHRINPDDTYSNIRYNFFSYDVEFGLTLNRLRERTRIIVSGFAGIGLTHGRTAVDLYDAGNNLYDFSGIDPDQDSKAVYLDLLELSDRKFETKVANKLALLPTAGFYLGYQFSRSFALGVEFKTHINLTEANSFTGIDIDNRAISGSGWDRNNYVSLGFRWQLGRGGSYGAGSGQYSSGGGNSYTTTETGVSVVAVGSSTPSVRITDPSAESMHTTTSSHTIRATIENVGGPGDISFFQNGFPVNAFAYDVNTKSFVSNVRLREGENSLRINATNQAAMAEDQVLIILDPAVAILPVPTAEFTSPYGNQHITSADGLEVHARVQHVAGKQDIQLTLNGVPIPFEYYPISGMVKTSVRRNPQASNLVIMAFNEAGSAEDQLGILFTEPVELATPMVRFINPPVPLEVDQNIFPLSAETFNVPGPNDVTLTLNGNNIRTFSYGANGVVKAGLMLAEGINTIDITARNDAGVAMERTFITYYAPAYHVPVYHQPVYQGPVVREPVYQEPVYREPVVQDPVYQEPVEEVPVTREPPKDAPVASTRAPQITITRPQADPFKTYDREQELHATVLNVTSKDNIILKINGISTRDFTFNLRTKEVITHFGLREGSNALTIQAQNEAGGDQAGQTFILEARPCPEPKITLLDPGQDQINTNQKNFVVKADVRNVAGKQQIRLAVNGKEISYSLDNHVLIGSITLVNGLNHLSLNAVNECGDDQASARINYSPDVVEEPCSPPRIEMAVREVQHQDATHELRGIVSHVKNKANISLSLDGQAINGFQFNPERGELMASFSLTTGMHSILVYANNDCGSDSKTESVLIKGDGGDGSDGGDGGGVGDGDDGGDGGDGGGVGDGGDGGDGEDAACGVRINPGNADWQFCLVTPSGTYNRSHLANSSFSYSGPASSLFFLPIAGGGNATVNGRPYALRSGQYYLFTGGLQVSVSSGNPGAMGQWSVCISASSAPVSGNGNNRPKSPCEGGSDEKDKGDKNNGNPNKKNDQEGGKKSTGGGDGGADNKTVNPARTGTDSRVAPGSDTRVSPRSGSSTRTAPNNSVSSGTRKNTSSRASSQAPEESSKQESTRRKR